MNFDIFDNHFLVVYLYPNIIEVYEIQMHIYLDFRMRLPLYKAF
jgi:hypothetical protein